MSRQVQLRRGTADEHKNFTGAAGEITIDTTTNTIRVHDGETAGGTPLALASDMPVPLDFCNAAMPSKRSIELTLEVTGTTYLAPGNGWFVVNKGAGLAHGYIQMVNNTTGLRSQARAGNSTNDWVFCNIPVSKGDAVRITYSLTGTTNSFLFVFANGSE